MNKPITFVLIFFTAFSQLSGQELVRTFIFGHSLINHEFQVNPTPSQETAVPHWFHFLSAHANHSYEVSGQYGFLPQHANLPPIAQWGFDHVVGAWESDTEPFSAADFSNILITPGNFIQWQAPTENYPQDTLSPASATETIFNWCMQQEDGLDFYIYENWPDMASFLGSGFPPAASEWEAYNQYLNGDFHNWFVEYHNLMSDLFPNTCVKMIPVGPAISSLLAQEPYNQIPISELYEDDAPHGRATTYFLASLLTYMAMYKEPAPLSYQVDTIIHPVIANNYAAVVNYLWGELNSFNDNLGNSKVFCHTPVSTTENQIQSRHVNISPNPVIESFVIEGIDEDHFVEIKSIFGYTYAGHISVSGRNNHIQVGELPRGIYLVIGRNNQDEILYQKRFAKF